jgi:hypothetical protein
MTGDFQVDMLMETRGQGRPGILIGVDEARLKQYFPDGSYPSETNAFLLRGGGRTVLIDTGSSPPCSIGGR